jgi:ligand-binding sensor domain-containing protein/signal transduction histidine kinase
MQVFSNFTRALALLWASFPLSGLSQIIPFEHYSTKDGLPSQWITALHQDSRGYLWIGSDEGISVYDGVHFKNYGVTDGLPVSHVWTVTESRAEPGAMWIGTHTQGVVKFKDGKFTTTQLSTTPASNTIATLLEDHEGVLWCGTNKGAYRIRDGIATLFQPAATAVGCVSSQTRDSTIWIGHGENIYRYYPRSGGTETLVSPWTDSPKRSMLEDAAGTLWLGTENGEILQCRGDRLVASKPLPFGEVRRLLPDYDGSLWAVTPRGVLNIPTQDFPKGALIHYSAENGLPQDDVISCLLDREYNLWLGTTSNGLAKLANRNILRFPLAGLRSDVMNRAAAADARGRLFVVCEQGLWEIWKRRDGSWRQHLHQPRDLPGPMWQLDFAPDSTLWIAMRRGGLCGYRIKPDGDHVSQLVRRRILRPGRDLPAGFPLAFIVDRHNQLWCNIRQLGVAHVDLNTAQPAKMYTMNDGLPDNTVRAIVRDRRDEIWFGGFWGGIAVFGFENGALKLRRKITKAEGLPDNSIRIITESRSGEIWVGTRFGGFAVWRDGEVRTFSTADSLLSNAVWGFAEDEKGGMWIGTTVGMQYFSPDFARLITDKKLVGEFAGSVGVVPGQMVWGVSNGRLMVYEAGTPVPPPVPPIVYIESLRVDGIARRLETDLKLPHHQNLCTMKFGGISFKDERALRFKYRLRGLEDSWQESAQERTVTFASLRPAAYTFEVQAINVDGVASATPASLAFTITPPLWERWWFITGVTFALACILYGFHRLSLRSALEIEKIRSRIALDLHDDIGAGLTHIGLLSEVALQKSRAARVREKDTVVQGLPTGVSEETHDLGDTVARMGNIARELSTAMGDVVWSINPKHDSVDALQRRLRAFAAEMCAAKSIQLKMDFSKQIAGLKLNPEVRRNLLLIAKEALHNMAKYSGSMTAQVAIQVHDKKLVLMVADAGKGFDPDKARNGNGLTNMHARAERINGVCEIVTAPGQGTRVTATVPY